MAGESLTQKAVLDWFARGIAHDPGLTPLMLLVGTREGKIGFVSSPQWRAGIQKDKNFKPALLEAVALVLADKGDEMRESTDAGRDSA